jgi:hypothetical protein
MACCRLFSSVGSALSKRTTALKQYPKFVHRSLNGPATGYRNSSTVPARLGRIFTLIPDIVIEILSPDDRQSENLARFRDYETLGVSHIIQMDPEEHVAHRYQRGSLIQTEFQSLSLPGRSDLPFDSTALFEQLRREVAETDVAADNGPHT